jgi:hypothetical protein
MSKDEYNLVDEAALQSWANRISRGENKEALINRIIETLENKPQSRATAEVRKALAELCLIIFKRQLDTTPEDAALLSLIEKLETIVAQTKPQDDTGIAERVNMDS